MACATTRPTFSFHISTSFPQSSPPKLKPHFTTAPPLLLPKLSFLHKPNKLESQEKFDMRGLEEKFAVLNTGIYECRSCGHKYDEAVGDPSYPIPPSLQFDKLPEDWRCPTCGAARLRGNALTSGQKAVIIYGSLLPFCVLFLSGYWLQWVGIGGGGKWDIV
ncbi:hypothetical protein I3843_07G007000 [Carya illinoinensis]|nr:hypothetical protein I3843_07G007000 [Carya illinoinensis]